MTDLSPNPPLPGGAGDKRRREHSALRRRMLEGCWDSDALDELHAFFPPETRATIGLSALDTSKCLLDKTASDLAVAYRRPPGLVHDDLPDIVAANGSVEAPGLVALKDRLDDAGLWQLQQDTERYLWGIREALVRPSWSEERGRLFFRMVYTDHVYAEAPAYDPDQPDVIYEARVRPVEVRGETKARWTWDVLSVRRDAEPYYRVLLPKEESDDPSEADDITTQVLKREFEGDAYPYIVEGEPVLPHVLYHASRNGRLWDPYRNRSIVRATLRAAAYYTFLGYALRDASFPQRVTIDCDLDTEGQVDKTAGVRRIPVSPTSILPLRSRGGSGGSIDQWQAALDPERIELTVSNYVAGALADVGLEADSGQERTGGPSSGWAISLRRSIVRERQLETEPQLRRGDSALLALSAALLNKHDPEISGLPESGWLPTYAGLPLSPAEVDASLEQAKGDIELGIASKVDLVLTRNPGWSREKAIQHLNDVARELRQFRDS